MKNILLMSTPHISRKNYYIILILLSIRCNQKVKCLHIPQVSHTVIKNLHCPVIKYIQNGKTDVFIAWTMFSVLNRPDKPQNTKNNNEWHRCVLTCVYDTKSCNKKEESQKIFRAFWIMIYFGYCTTSLKFVCRFQSR